MFLIEVELHHLPLSHSSLLLLPLALPPAFPISHSQIHQFSWIVTQCVHMYVGEQTYKYSLLNLFLLFMCIRLQGWSLSIVQETRELTHPGRGSFSCPRGNTLLVVLCLWVGAHENLPSHVYVSTDSAIALVSFMQPFLGDTVPPDCPVLWLLESFCPLFSDVPWTTDAGAVI